MSDKYVRVTDRRMFTADGELREEFNYLDGAEGASGEAPEVSPEPSTTEPPTPEPTTRAMEPEAASPARQPEPDPNAADPEEDKGAAGFPDLVRLLAEHASVYFTEARRGGPQQAAQHLEMARIHVDLLRVLQDKTRGNLTADEQRMLDDVLYQLRSAFVGMQG